jgi:hypothetical protein
LGLGCFNEAKGNVACARQCRDPLRGMSTMPTKRIKSLLILLGSIAFSISTALSTTPAFAQEDSWVGEISSYSEGVLVGHDYVWSVPIWQPAPAKLAGDENPGLPVAVTVTFGDGSHADFSSDVAPGPTDSYWFWCDTSENNFGYNCRVEFGHTYTAQGIYTMSMDATQGGSSASSPIRQQVVVDQSLGGSVTVKGTLWARSGGMYQQNFNGGLASVDVTAKRRPGTLATTVSAVVSVPNMRADWNQARGMTFRGTGAWQPLFITKTRTGGEALMIRVEGTVRNSMGSAGSAYMMLHVLVEKGSPTLARVTVWNTAAGYTYMDTGTATSPFLALDPDDDRLLSGTVKLG